MATSQAISGTESPITLSDHVQGKIYESRAITISDLMQEHGAEAVDVDALYIKFCDYCHDGGESMSANLQSEAIWFAKTIIYEIGPESRTVKSSMPDRYWKFRFQNKDENDKADPKEIMVATFKRSSPKSEETKTQWLITVKQASYISLKILSDITPFLTMKSIILLTPLAGAIYSRQDIIEMWERLSSIDKNFENLAYVVMVVNNSCQPGGHYLEGSRIECALAASITSTKHMKDQGLREKIYVRTAKQYTTAGRIKNDQIFRIFSEFACGGLSADLDFKTMLEKYEDAQKMRFTRQEYNTIGKMTTMKTKTSGKGLGGTHVNLPSTPGMSGPQLPKKGEEKEPPAPPKK